MSEKIFLSNNDRFIDEVKLSGFLHYDGLEVAYNDALVDVKKAQVDGNHKETEKNASKRLIQGAQVQLDKTEYVNFPNAIFVKLPNDSNTILGYIQFDKHSPLFRILRLKPDVFEARIGKIDLKADNDNQITIVIKISEKNNSHTTGKKK